jgi:DNA-binding MarR family transcriptional regulator
MMPPPGPPEAVEERAARTADRLHSLSIHLLRRLRREDEAAGLSAPQLSALSVVVFGGPVTVGELAEAEQVRPPTISRLVQRLERDGLVSREPDLTDRRVVRVRATRAGEQVLEEGRARRVAALAARLAALEPAELATLADAADLLERVLAAE